MPYFDRHKAHRIATKQAEADERAAMLAHMDPATQAAYKMTDRAISACEELVPQVAILQNDFSGFRKMIEHGGGLAKVGVPDLRGLGETVAAVAHHKLGIGGPDIVAKSAELLRLGSDGRGGHLVAPEVARTIDHLTRGYGALWSRCDEITTPIGQSQRVPAYSTPPSAAWQLTEGEALDEQDVVITAVERRPFPVGGFVQLSAQLVGNGSTDVLGELAAEQFRANVQAAEVGLVSGDGGTDAPADGLLELGGTHSQSALATVTPSLMSKFVGESIADCPALYENGVLVMSPQVLETLAASSTTSGHTTRLIFDGRPAPTAYFGRWECLATPAAGMNVLMCDPKKIKRVNAGYSLIVDNLSGSRNLIVYLVAVTWANWGVTLPGTISKAEITALS